MSYLVANPRTYSKTCLKRLLSKRPKNGFQDQLSLNAGRKYCIAECSKGGILQYFRPALSYHLSLRSLFCLFLSDRLRQVLLFFLAIMTTCHTTILHSFSVANLVRLKSAFSAAKTNRNIEMMDLACINVLL